VVELLLKRGAEINALDYSRKTALHYAINNEHTAIVELLKSFGAQD